jgi:hypothetical protein
MANAEFTKQMGWTGQQASLIVDLGNNLEQAPAATAPRGLLARLGDLFLNLLDLGVHQMGLHTPETQAPLPPMPWTPYSGSYMESALYQRGTRARWWGS